MNGKNRIDDFIKMCLMEGFLAKNIAEASGKKIKISKLAGFFIKIFKNAEIVRKAFGSLYYDESCADKIDFIDVRRAILDSLSSLGKFSTLLSSW